MNKFDTQTNPNVPGKPVSASSKLIETGASIVQEFLPLKNVCAYLNAFHVYADDPGRRVEAQHYCMHVSEGVRQCLLFDTPTPNARLIGVEYMITRELYEGLDPEERKLWHSHVFEVKSGQLVMPKPEGSLMPDSVWEIAENKEMEEVVKLYGKTWQTWQVDRGDKLPLGRPQLMGSFVKETDGFRACVDDRDMRMGTDRHHKAKIREYIHAPEIHPDADHWDHSKQC
ncbi:hypothetical protein FPQ18DRAFT_289288 [Pyronema domesticum]|uniref:DUF1264-domain-containing protein n=1 Tax=Pyronema omphalodes (strain CBS 100304) TaxID=1076935 RepID=U4L8B5_PYROM|nr:hypothetical protein FPQ18DRAFT_289288 [Pyronema domesticum]CCX13662.1 Similar to hypothetical protein SCHCODRAFT_58311 [Schizophyllum commune H4-8]; acc. no. XP_003029842 [Pyronema omphalodes CBS 100304]